MKLLLIGQDPAAASWLEPRLQTAGFRVSFCETLGAAFAPETSGSLAAILLDLGHDCPDGAQATSQIRARGLIQPLLLLSARSDWREKVASLEAGADDFIVKPVRSEEIAARLHSSIRRSMGMSHNRSRIGNFELDLGKRCAWQGGKCLELTRNEFAVLRLLLQEPGRVVGPEELRSAISPNAPITLNAIEVLIARLRKKVGITPIKTVRGLGYRFVLDDSQTLPDDPEACRKGEGSACCESGEQADSADIQYFDCPASMI